MFAYAMRRILSMIPLLILISFVVFTLALMMPGDPFSGEIDPNTPAEYQKEMRDKLGYNDPIPVQYKRWITKVVTEGDFGQRSEEHTSELQSRGHLVCRLLLEKKKK